MILFLTSCGEIKDFLVKDSPPPPPKASDPILREYVNRFEDLYGIRVNVPINFSELGLNHAGVCTQWASGYAEIEVDETEWHKFNLDQREQLIFHELGHCVFSRQHDNGTLPDTCPKSIMRSFMFNSFEIYKCYKPMHNYYVDELKP